MDTPLPYKAFEIILDSMQDYIDALQKISLIVDITTEQQVKLRLIYNKVKNQPRPKNRGIRRRTPESP